MLLPYLPTCPPASEGFEFPPASEGGSEYLPASERLAAGTLQPNPRYPNPNPDPYL